MDFRYEKALSNATRAWSQNRMTDPITLQHLKVAQPQTPNNLASLTQTAQGQPTQPELARFGKLGTQLNLFV